MTIEASAYDIEEEYGLRGEAAINEFGTEPLEKMLENEEEVSVDEMEESLLEDREYVNKRFLGIYMEILDEAGLVEKTDDGKLFRPRDKAYRKNGVKPEEAINFMSELYSEP